MSTTDRRLLLHSVLTGITAHVYFQAPPTLVYPCILYELDDADTEFAGNVPYRLSWRYKVTVIDRNPDSDIPPRVAALPTCTFDRFFVVNNLNNFVFTLYS